MNIVIIIGHILAIAIGLSLGLIGGGGSVLAVPIFIYVMGIGTKEAIAMSLVIVGTVSIIGIIPHWMKGNINFKIALIFTPSAMLGSFCGARFTAFSFVTETFQLICFAIVMLLASSLMIFKSREKKVTNCRGERIKNKPNKFNFYTIVLQGFGVGILTGFVGVGGGFLIIPALVLLANIPMKEAIGTSLLIISFNCVSGFLGYVTHVNLNWYLMFSLTFAASLGTILGAYLTKFVNGKQLQKVFGYFVLAVAVFVLINR